MKRTSAKAMRPWIGRALLDGASGCRDRVPLKAKAIALGDFTAEERQEMTPDGRFTRLEHSCGLALSNMKRDGLLVNDSGLWCLTKKGRDWAEGLDANATEPSSR
jgi:restriction endonuclease Mrr